jgi:hypothetical protein
VFLAYSAEEKPAGSGPSLLAACGGNDEDAAPDSDTDTDGTAPAAFEEANDGSSVSFLRIPDTDEGQRRAPRLEGEGHVLVRRHVGYRA